MPAMAVEESYTYDQISIQSIGDPAATVAVNLDAKPVLVAESQRTIIVAYTAPKSNPKLSDNLDYSDTGTVQTGYSSNEVGWQA